MRLLWYRGPGTVVNYEHHSEGATVVLTRHGYLYYCCCTSRATHHIPLCKFCVVYSYVEQQEFVPTSKTVTSATKNIATNNTTAHGAGCNQTMASRPDVPESCSCTIDTNTCCSDHVELHNSCQRYE